MPAKLIDANFAKSFRGKRFDKEEKKRIFDRVLNLYKEGVSVDVMTTIMQKEGFRRVDGSDLTESWVTKQLNDVKSWFHNHKGRKLSGPVKTIYKKSEKAKEIVSPKKLKKDEVSSKEVILAVMRSDLEQRVKDYILEAIL